MLSLYCADPQTAIQIIKFNTKTSMVIMFDETDTTVENLGK